MTIASEQVINGVTQERNLVSELPGPRSRGLLARKEDAVSSGVGFGPPVFVTKAGGGILVDANGNSLIDMGSVNATISQSE
jgi:4-aminobutyrate aminotransferase/(S)-3-amino-2-methylpropionate transaminase